MVIDILASVFFAGISLISVPANFLVVWSILSNQNFYNYHHCLLVLQSLRDLLFHFLVNFYTVSTLANSGIIFGQTTCRVSAYICRVWYFGTALNLAGITCERYDSLANCLTHSKKITPKRALFIIFCLIILPLVSGLPLLLGETKYINLLSFYGCKNNDNGADVGSVVVAFLGVGLSVVFTFIPAIIIAKKSWQIFKIARRHRRDMKQLQPGEILSSQGEELENSTKDFGNNPSGAEKQKKIFNDRKKTVERVTQVTNDLKKASRNIKKAIKILVVNVGYLVSLLPIWTVKFYARIDDGQLDETPKWLFVVVYWLSFSCTILHPFNNSFRELRNMTGKFFNKRKPTLCCLRKKKNSIGATAGNSSRQHLENAGDPISLSIVRHDQAENIGK